MRRIVEFGDNQVEIEEEYKEEEEYEEEEEQ